MASLKSYIIVGQRLAFLIVNSSESPSSVLGFLPNPHRLPSPWEAACEGTEAMVRWAPCGAAEGLCWPWRLLVWRSGVTTTPSPRLPDEADGLLPRGASSGATLPGCWGWG